MKSDYGEFVALVLDQFKSLGDVHLRAMFGGYGIYHGDIFFALIDDDRLYFKTDAQTCAEFKQRGLKPFTYRARGKTIALHYYEAPAEVFEDEIVMQHWAQQAIAVAVRAKKGNKNKKQQKVSAQDKT